jgi:hypothetical protein
MRVSRRCLAGSAIALATLVTVCGVMGCGGGAVTAKADVVDVTYYYLPG